MKRGTVQQKEWFDTIGIDQYGEKLHSLGKHPRKELLRRLGRKHAVPMYQDTDEGYRQIGWIIAGRQIRVLKVTEFFQERR